MGSEYDSGGLGSFLSTGLHNHDPLAGLFDTNTHQNEADNNTTGRNLQLAPLYSNPRHQQQRESIADILNRYQGQTGFPYHSADHRFDDNYEEEHESHVGYDANGMHVGVNMSRSRQTPYGTARTNVGMQMSIGPDGMMFRTRSSSSIGGSRGGLFMMASFGRRSYRPALGQGLLGSIGSILSPLSSLLSPQSGMFSPMSGSNISGHEQPPFGFRRQSQNKNVPHGSDGPIIEEIFDEEEEECSDLTDETSFSSKLAIDYKENETDSSLGLGLLPDTETANNGNSYSRRLQEVKDPCAVNTGIVNEFPHTEDSQTTEERNHDTKIENSVGIGPHKNQTIKSRLVDSNQDENSFKFEAKINKNRLNKCTDETVSKNNGIKRPLDVSNEFKQLEIREREKTAKCESKGSQKFTKQTFRNTSFRFNDGHNGLSFLKSTSSKDNSFDNGLSASQGNAAKVSVPKQKVNKNKQMTKSKIGLTNKNASVRRRNDSFSSTSPEEGRNAQERSIGNEMSNENFDYNNRVILQKDATIVGSELGQELWSTKDIGFATSEGKNLSKTKNRHIRQETEENLKYINGDSSPTEFISSNDRPYSLSEPIQLSKAFTTVTANDTDSKTSSEIENVSKENTNSRETTEKYLLIEANTDVTYPENRYVLSLEPYETFGGDKDNKSNSEEQSGSYLDTQVGRSHVDTGQQEKNKTALFDKGNDKEEKVEYKCNVNMLPKNLSLQEFSSTEITTSLSLTENGNHRKEENPDNQHCEQAMNTATINLLEENKLQKENDQKTERMVEEYKQIVVNKTEIQQMNRLVDLGTTEEGPYSQNERGRCSPELESFEFDREVTTECKLDSRGSEPKEYQALDLNFDRILSENFDHISVPNQKHNTRLQSNQRRQNMNKTITNGDNVTDTQCQYPGHEPQRHLESLNENESTHNANSTQVKHSAHSGGFHVEYLCDYHIHQLTCDHKYITKYIAPCCKTTHYACEDCGKPMTSEDCEKRKAGNDEELPQHPDWQFLNKYEDTQGQFADPKHTKEKAKVNKNASVKTSLAAASPEKGNSGSDAGNETKSRAYTFGELVESVGLTMKDVYPDGNCLFTAICDQLRIRGDFSYTPRDLRHAAVDYLREHPNQEDGTPLQAFLTDDECNWEKYLMSMRRDGHWGDHFVIWALAHVLHRKIVIYRGNIELQKTVVEPTRTAANDETRDGKNSPGGTKGGNKGEKSGQVAAHGKDRLLQSIQADELYLGHISESHYVSLRPNNWRERLFEVLKNKQTGCLVGCNSRSKPLVHSADVHVCTPTDFNGDVSAQEEAPLFSSADLNFFLNYLRRGSLILKYEMHSTSPTHRTYCTTHFLGDLINGFEYRLSSTIKANTGSQTKGPAEHSCFFLSTPHDTTVVFDRRHGNDKDLVVHNENNKEGQFKLTPVKSKSWKPLLILREGLSFLRHIEYKDDKPMAKSIVVGFKCESWPEEATEWKTRKRSQPWPSLETIDEIVKSGVRVIPVKQDDADVDEKEVHGEGRENGNVSKVSRKHENIECSSKHLSSNEASYGGGSVNEGRHLIWEYDFAISEHILSQREIGTETKTLHSILVALTSFAFEGRKAISKYLLKTLTFFTCEKLSSEEITHQPGKCLIYELDLLKEYLQRKHFPHYFMRGRNLIADMEYEDIVWHVERLQVLKSNVMVILYCALDCCTLQNVNDVGKVFNVLVMGAGTRNRRTVIPETYLEELCSTSVANLIKPKIFEGAEMMIDTWYKELLDTADENTISKEQFVDKILLQLPLQEEWLFALYLDCQEGSEYVHYICKGKDCVQFQNLFGNEVAFILCQETLLRSEEIPLPTSIFGENIANLAKRVAEVIRFDLGNIKAYQLAIHHFLKSNTHDILLSVEKDQKEKNDYYFDVKVSTLKVLYMDLYESYQLHRSTYTFRDLMETYDELCNFLATDEEFVFLAKLWEFFGQHSRARQARMKTVSVRDETYMNSTTF